MIDLIGLIIAAYSSEKTKNHRAR